MADDKPISPRRDPKTVAEMLLRTHGLEKALKRVASEKASARRARSRVRFQFWTNISGLIAAQQPDARS